VICPETAPKEITNPAITKSAGDLPALKEKLCSLMERTFRDLVIL